MSRRDSYEDLFNEEFNEAAVVACKYCGEEDLFWDLGVLTDEDGDKHICDQAEGFGEVTDDSN